MKNDLFSSEIGSRFGEPGGTPPPRIPRRTPGDYVTYDKSAETLARQTRLIKIVTLNGIFTLKRSFVICQQFPTFLQKLNGGTCSRPSSAPPKKRKRRPRRLIPRLSRTCHSPLTICIARGGGGGGTLGIYVPLGPRNP